MWWWLVAAVALVLGGSVYCKASAGRCRCGRSLVGLTAVVTGGSAGIGYHTAVDLARRGAKVIIASRSAKRGTQARDKIIFATGNPDVHFRVLDLQSLKSIREFAQTIINTEKRLDILINNAGILGSQDEKTKDGLNPTMQTNHFGPFLLTNLLIPLLKASAPSRIVTVSSVVYRFGEIDIDNLNMEKRPKRMMAIYANSKLCNILMTVELAKRLRGTGVTANCLHPGLVMTDIHPSARSLSLWKKRVLTPLAWLFIKTGEQGAQTSIHVAVSNSVNAKISGEYFSDCKRTSLAAKARNEVTAKQLWEVSESLVGLTKDLNGVSSIVYSYVDQDNMVLRVDLSKII